MCGLHIFSLPRKINCIQSFKKQSFTKMKFTPLIAMSINLACNINNIISSSVSSSREMCLIVSRRCGCLGMLFWYFCHVLICYFVTIVLILIYTLCWYFISTLCRYSNLHSCCSSICMTGTALGIPDHNMNSLSTSISHAIPYPIPSYSPYQTTKGTVPKLFPYPNPSLLSIRSSLPSPHSLIPHLPRPKPP